MRLPKWFVFPATFNLGSAPPPPRSAAAYAPRATLLQIDAMGFLPPNQWAGSSPLVLDALYLPQHGLSGPVTEPVLQPGLIPNPYQPNQW